MVSRLARLLLAALFLLPGACAPDREPGALSDNPEATAAYEAASALWASATTTSQRDEAIAGMERALELDPDFVMALVYLSGAHAWVHQNWDRSPERAERAKWAAERALELDPGEPAAHQALGSYYYRIAKDYEAALSAYARASELAPDDPAILRMVGYIHRRAGRMEEALTSLSAADAVAATPASLVDLALTYRMARRFGEARQTLERALALEPDRAATQAAMASLHFDETGDLEPVRAFLASQPEGYVGNKWYAAMVDGDYQGALAALDLPGADPLVGQYAIQPRSLLAALARSRMGAEAEARDAYQQARTTMEAMVAERPDDPRTHLALGLALAGLGLKEEAIRAGRSGVELLPPEEDLMIGTHSVWWLAEIYALAGEPEQAVEQLRMLLSEPSAATPANLRLDPWLQGIAGHPAFTELVGG